MNRYIAFILLTISVAHADAQLYRSIRGRVIDGNGKGVVYATVGVPGTEYGTLSGKDGGFCIELPMEGCDTLRACHVSYSEKNVVVGNEVPDTLCITMSPRPLDEVVVYDGKRRKARLSRRGTRIPGGLTSWSSNRIGCEIGSNVSVKRPFDVREISFTVISNDIDNIKVSVNIYPIGIDGSVSQNLMHKPLYADIPVNMEQKMYTITPDENITLGRGEYFVSVRLVDCNAGKGSIHFPLYLKKSYIRSGIMDELEEIPINMGLVIEGEEYRKRK